MKLIFSGIDKAFFNNLAFNNQVTASWLSIEELMSTGPEVDNSDVKYVVFYSSPEAFLSERGNKTIGNLVTAEQQWLPQTELLIQFYLANKVNAILVDSEQCERNSDAFTKLINQKFNTNSQLSINSNQQVDDAKKLLEKSLQLTLVIALSEHYDIQNTFENVISAADLLVASDDYSPEDRACTLRDNCESLVKKINAKYSKYTDVGKENEQSLLQVQQLQEALDTSSKKYNTAQEQLTLNKEVTQKTLAELSVFDVNNKQLIQEKTILESNITELTSENELSLLQVNQLQEELEASVSQHKTAQEQLTLNKEVTEKTLAELSVFDVNNKQLIQEKTILESNITELTSENELSLLQVNQLQEELETSDSQHKTAQEQLTINKEVTEKTLAELSEFYVNNKQLTQEKIILESSITELTSENELSLLQVQQLQEELEATYSDYKTSEEKLKFNIEANQKTVVTLSGLEVSNKQLTQEKTILESSITELTSENEVSLLQVQQLQEELEVLFLENNELKHVEKKLTEQNINKKDKEQLLDLKADNEIALLQIQQLQEELEFYFSKYKSLNDKNCIANITPIEIVAKHFEKSLILAKLLNA